MSGIRMGEGEQFMSLQEYIIGYLAISPFVAAHAAIDTRNVLLACILGLLWPIWLLIVLIYLLLHLNR